MRFKFKEKYVYIEETVIIIIFLCILSNRARTFLSNYFMCYLFVAFHEVAHIFIASLLGYEFRRINIRLAGLNAIFKEKINGIKGIIIYFAGPIANIILAIIFKNIRMVFEINIALACINMFPVKPLDGYNILNLLLKNIFAKKIAEKCINLTEKTMEILFFMLAILIVVKKHNFSLIAMVVYIKANSLKPLKSL